jgi:hypothetical protein
MNEEEKNAADNYPVYSPDDDERDAIQEVLKTLERGRNILNRSYDYFNGRSLFEVIDDWTKRWNGYIPPQNPLLDQTQSQIFVNFTRNAVIAYLSKVAMSPVKAKIAAVNKKSGLPDRAFADALSDLNDYSLNEENGPAKFLQAGIECAVKGTVVVYEGYMKNSQKVKVPIDFDAMTGKAKYKEEERTIYDNCYQEVIPLEDFYILNPFQADVQKQPKVIWKQITSYSEVEMEFSHYPDWKYVKPGQYVTGAEPTTFYREVLLTALEDDQCEVLKYYCRYKNRHVIMVNGVILYDGPIPFKDGMYPFAKAINEPFGIDFFWGNGHPGRYMGEQDLINTFVNLMADKTINSLIPTGLSSDLDDLAEDDVIQIGKIRKVGDVRNWQWWEAPEVGGGEFNFFQSVLQLARESASTQAGDTATSKGGKETARQVLLRQQEVMQKLSFNMNFLEDLERDRTKLRLNHILQFYSIPKMEKITGKVGQLQTMVYRDVHLSNAKLSDGQQGSKVIKLVGKEYLNPDKREQLADELSLTEAQGEIDGQNVEALAVVVDTFYDYNLEVQVVRYSSWEKNQALDQAARMEFANWRIPLAAGGVDPKTGQPIQPVAPADVPAIVKWVEESFDVPSDEFEQEAGQQPQQPGMQQPGQQGPPGGSPQTLNNMQPSRTKENAMNQVLG